MSRTPTSQIGANSTPTTHPRSPSCHMLESQSEGPDTNVRTAASRLARCVISWASTASSSAGVSASMSEEVTMTSGIFSVVTANAFGSFDSARRTSGGGATSASPATRWAAGTNRSDSGAGFACVSDSTAPAESR